MGYRSEVAFCITVDQVLVKPEAGSSYWNYDKAKFKEMMGFIKLSRFYEIAISPDYDLLNVTAGEQGIGWDKGVFMFHAEDWKWYEDYSIVIAYRELWEQMQTIEGISGYYLRVGEEQGDIEEAQFGDSPENNYFGAFTRMSFDAGDILGKTITDEEEQTEQAQTDTQPDCAGTHHATQA